MNVRNILVAASLSAVASVAMAKAAKEPNCEVNGKKSHVKDEKACTKKKGTWTGTASSMAAPATDSASGMAAPAAGGAAPAAPAAGGMEDKK